MMIIFNIYRENAILIQLLSRCHPADIILRDASTAEDTILPPSLTDRKIGWHRKSRLIARGFLRYVSDMAQFSITTNRLFGHADFRPALSYLFLA